MSSEINLNLILSSLPLGKSKDFDRKHGLQKVIETVPAAVVSNTVHLHLSNECDSHSDFQRPFPKFKTETLPQTCSKNTHTQSHTHICIYIYIELQIYTHNYVPSKAGVPWFSNTAKFCDIICHSGRPETRNVLDVLSLAALQSRD